MLGERADGGSIPRSAVVRSRGSDAQAGLTGHADVLDAFRRAAHARRFMGSSTTDR